MCHAEALSSAVAGRQFGMLCPSCHANEVSIDGYCSLGSSTGDIKVVWMHADAEGAPGNQLGAAADMDEKELAQRDAHIRSFAIAQVLHIPGAYLTCWQCCRSAEHPSTSLVNLVQDVSAMAVIS